MCALVTSTGVALGLTYTTIIFLLTTITNGTLPNQIWPTELSNFNTKNRNGTLNALMGLLNPEPNIQFKLFTRCSGPFNFRIDELTDPQLLGASGFNASSPTKIIIHGFQSNLKGDIFVVNKNAYLDSGDFNVIGMDWSALCESEYLSAVRGVQTAGAHLARLLNWFLKIGIALDNFHIIGHSLGAHVAGIGAYNLSGNAKVGRITGLDPAGPGFRDMSKHLMLDRTDAKLVDVIHTYMKVLSLATPIGHLDFYPNGGRWQPGCPDIYNVWRMAESLFCNHARAYYLFAEGVRNRNAFKSKQCRTVDDALHNRCAEDTNVYMGYAESYNRFGLFYVRTRGKKPYSFSLPVN